VDRRDPTRSEKYSHVVGRAEHFVGASPRKHSVPVYFVEISALLKQQSCYFSDDGYHSLPYRYFNLDFIFTGAGALYGLSTSPTCL
jgi:hypothetical protein